MQSEQLEKFSLQIQDRLTVVEQKISELRPDLLKAAEVQPTILQDGSDHAKEEADLNTRLEIHEQHMSERGKLRLALKRIEAGSFGVCGICGCDVDVRRLEIQPSVAFCVYCQQSEERKPVIREEKIAWIGKRTPCGFWNLERGDAA
jgi:DnaK suppressor protein